MKTGATTTTNPVSPGVRRTISLPCGAKQCIYCVCLCVATGVRRPGSGVYFFAELIKCVVATGVCMYQSRTDPDIRKAMIWDRHDVIQYSIPGFVFFAQNNLSFLALQHMSNATFQLLLNMRIISVALLSIMFLSKRLNALEWLSIVFLTAGAMNYQLSNCEKGLMVDMEGLLVMLVIIICAAGGNVLTQKVMQKKMEQPLMLQNAILYSWGIAMNGANWVLTTHSNPTQGWFGKIEAIQVTSMVFYAVYGLSISVILKRFGAITRTFINTAAIVFTAVLDAIFFKDRISNLALTSFIVILAAVYAYTNLSKDYKPAREDKPRETGLLPPTTKNPESV